MLVHASLFSGIGGFDLAADWMGWDNLFHCEWNPFGQRVLKHHFPKSISYNDITKTNFTIHEGSVDILTGGFPCQPYSTAGKRLGKADERHLFPHMLRCIKEVKPRWVVGENVRGLVNWNGGLVFNEVYDDLEREGYEVQSFLIPAASVNAPHQRYRIWFVAYCKDIRCEPTKTSNKWEEYIQNDRNGIRTIPKSNGEIWDVTNTNSGRLERTIEERWDSKYVKRENGINAQKSNASDSTSIRLEQCSDQREVRRETTDAEGQRCQSSFATKTISGKHQPNWDNFPTQSAVCGRDDGIPKELDSITFSKWRNESIKAYGNAIVPQVAYEIFKAIEEFELMVNK